jgi:hypothetical protein
MSKSRFAADIERNMNNVKHYFLGAAGHDERRIARHSLSPKMPDEPDPCRPVSERLWQTRLLEDGVGKRFIVQVGGHAEGAPGPRTEPYFVAAFALADQPTSGSGQHPDKSPIDLRHG